MIDIHSHIIPNVDDGARSVEETFNILKEAQEAGFTDVILTSHFLLNYYETNAQELIFWKEKLQEVLKKQGTKINLLKSLPVDIKTIFKSKIIFSNLVLMPFILLSDLISTLLPASLAIFPPVAALIIFFFRERLEEL